MSLLQSPWPNFSGLALLVHHEGQTRIAAFWLCIVRKVHLPRTGMC